MSDFDSALAAFLAAAAKDIKAHADTFNEHMSYADDGSEYFGPLKNGGGRKYLRLLTGGNRQCMVYCFIAMHDVPEKNVKEGDILFAASYKAPQLKAVGSPARGSIYDPSSYEDANLAHTSWLYRR